MRVNIKGYRTLFNILLTQIVFGGGLGFFLAGLSSFFKVNLLPNSNSLEITYIPQGLALTFYGTVGLVVGIFMGLCVWWDVGSGYYEINSKNIVIFRKLFPGKGRDLELIVPREFLKSLKIQIASKSSSVTTFLVLKNNNTVPLITSDKPLYLIEREIVGVAKILKISIETNFE